ncbi:hypothetical protein ACVPPR_01305 [Dellaglioa sp. L3N]
MKKTVKFYFNQIGILKICVSVVVIFLIATLISIIILHGLSKDQKVFEMLPVAFKYQAKSMQFCIVFYCFEGLFLRASILFLQGFLAFQVVANTIEIRQILTYPLTRTGYYFGRLLIVCIISGIILIPLHGISFGLLVLFFGKHLSVVFLSFLIEDFLLDFLFILVGVIPCIVAIYQPKVAYVISSSILMIITLCNATIASFRSQSISIPLIMFMVIIVAGIIGIWVSLRRFKQIDI